MFKNTDYSLSHIGNHLVIVNHLTWNYRFVSPVESLILGFLYHGMVGDEISLFLSELKGVDIDESNRMVKKSLNSITEFMDTDNFQSLFKYDPFDKYLELLEGEKNGSITAAPIKIILFLTPECNFNCEYCCFDLKSHRNDNFELNHIKEIIDDLSEMGTPIIYISGGEPLIYNSILDVIQYITDKGLTPALSTNGSFLSQIMVDQLKKAGLRSIQVSLDSHLDTIHHRMTRTTNTFDDVIQGIKYLKEAGVWVSTKTVVNEVNCDDVAEIVHFLTGLDVDQIGLSIEAMPEYSKKARKSGANITTNDIGSIRTTIENLKKIYGQNRLLFGDIDKKWETAKDIIPCGNLSTCCVVHPSGEVNLCEKIRGVEELSYGNVYENQVSEIWGGVKHLEVVRNISLSVKGNKCGECKHFKKCYTGCFNQSKMIYNDFFVQDPRCCINT